MKTRDTDRQWERLLKALITKTPTDEYCEKLTKAGFDGIEVQNWDVSVEEARQARAFVEKHGLCIHSVMRGWTNFNASEKEKVDADIQSVETSLRAAAAYGASTVLLVPCRIGGMTMPEPWDFDIDFDPKTLNVKTVAAGDNSAYADYIKAQNLATEVSIRAVETLIPTAAREGVIIALENVGNNLWSTPEFLAAFVKSFGSPWVQTYFDLGNHTRYSRCEEWLTALQGTIVKLHIKDSAISEAKGKRGGGPSQRVPIGTGTIDWKNVRKVLEEIRYSGWMTVESSGLTDAEHSKFLDEHFGE
ncbi:MAG: sugar phosphate isomerase/epimerase [Planctomycetaceae bacterium]|nr:sugar phosphate isomerase/epimerase [Planctomycetaceae bacterium]